MVTENDLRSKDNAKRIEKLEQRQNEMGELVTSVALIAQRQENVETDVKEIKADVKTLTEKPAKKWDSMGEKLLWLLLAAVIGFALAHVGLAT